MPPRGHNSGGGGSTKRAISHKKPSPMPQYLHLGTRGHWGQERTKSKRVLGEGIKEEKKACERNSKSWLKGERIIVLTPQSAIKGKEKVRPRNIGVEREEKVWPSNWGKEGELWTIPPTAGENANNGIKKGFGNYPAKATRRGQNPIKKRSLNWISETGEGNDMKTNRERGGCKKTPASDL